MQMPKRKLMVAISSVVILMLGAAVATARTAGHHSVTVPAPRSTTTSVVPPADPVEDTSGDQGDQNDQGDSTDSSGDQGDQNDQGDSQN
jgi:hypothetical protein